MAEFESAEDRWWAAELECADPDETGFLAHELGAKGVHILDSGSLRAFFSGTEEEFQRFVALFQERGIAVRLAALVENENWVAKCDDLLRPLQIGSLLVAPVSSVEDQPPEPPKANELRIVPGMGFGTGHHPSTAMALEFMQRAEVVGSRPAQVLDIGTGSGILAIGACRLYPNVEVRGCDIDAGAVKSAAENIRMNHFEGQVTLSHGTVSGITGQFAIVLANIYAEVLIEIENEIRERAAPGAFLILAGILDDREAEIRQRYAPCWTVLSSGSREGWSSFLMQKR